MTVTTTTGSITIALELEDLEDLFVSRPVDPLRGRFDDRSGVAHLLDELEPSREPTSEPVTIDITLTNTAAVQFTDEQVMRALARFAEAEIARAEIEKAQIGRLGMRELAFGLCFLAACLVGGSALAAFEIGPDWIRDFIVEGLVIVGWIALWHPVDMLFFERLPLRRRQRVLGRLRGARVRVRSVPR